MASPVQSMVAVLCCWLIIAGLCCNNRANYPETKEYRIAIRDLVTEYEENEFAADARYKDKMLLVSGGKVDKIGRNLWGTPFIVLSEPGEDRLLPVIQCNFDEGSHMDGLSALRPGMDVRIGGICDRKYSHILMMRACSIKY